MFLCVQVVGAKRSLGGGRKAGAALRTEPDELDFKFDEELKDDSGPAGRKGAFSEWSARSFVRRNIRQKQFITNARFIL